MKKISTVLILMLLFSVPGQPVSAADLIATDFNTMGNFTTAGQKVQLIDGVLHITNAGNSNATSAQVNGLTIPDDFIFLFRAKIGSPSKSSGLNIRDGKRRVQLYLHNNRFGYRNTGGSLTEVEYPLEDDWHEWAIVCKDDNVDIYIDGSLITSYPIPDFSGTSTVQYFVEANTQETGNFQVDSTYLRAYTQQEANQIADGTYGSLKGTQTQAQIADLNESDYPNEVRLLADIGALQGDENGMIHPSVSATRAELAELLYRMAGRETMSDQIYFQDVMPDFWAYASIAACTQMGYLTGDGTGYFHPDQPVSLIDAATAMLNVLGYRERAMNTGGYPTGYLLAANEMHLFSGIPSNYRETATKDQIYKLMYNALLCHPLRLSSVEGAQVGYIQSPDTLLYELYNIYQATGTVTANAITSLTDADMAAPNEQVVIDNIPYSAGSTDVANKIGQQIDLFYREDESLTVPEIISYVPNQNNTVVELDAKDIVELQSDKCQYVQDTKLKKLTLSSNIDLLYNGIARLDKTIPELKPRQGYVQLIDADGNGIYDVLTVWEFTDYEVLSVNRKTLAVECADGTVFDFSEFGPYHLIDFYGSDGQKSKFDRIRAGSILSVFESTKDKKYAKVYISNDTVTGAIDEKSFDPNMYTIGEMQYLLSENYTDDLKLGDTADFLLNYRGEIASYDGYQSKASYGYLLEAANTGTLDSQVKLQIFTTDGKAQIFPAMDEISLNGAPKEETIGIIRAPELYNENGIIQQLIQYKTNAKGAVTELFTAQEEDGTYNKDRFTLNGKLSSATFTGTAKCFGSMYLIDNDTLAFGLPDEINGRLTEEDIAILPISTFKNGIKYDLDIYNADETHVAGIVVSKTSSGFNTYENFFIFENFVEALNENGKVQKKAKGYLNGSEVSYFIDPDLETTQPLNLSFGDLLRISVGTDGQIRKITEIFSPSDPTAKLSLKYVDGSYRGAKGVAIYGSVVSKTDTAFTETENGTDVYPHLLGSGNLYLLDLSEKTITTGYASDIRPGSSVSALDGSKVFLMKRYDVTLDTVIVVP